MSQFLKLKGVDVVGETRDGKTAVEIYKELKPDVIITDMKMPEYDGVYVINEVTEFDPGAKIIVVTAYQEYNFDRKKVFSTLIKPYNVEELLRKIKQIEDLLV
jgi:two-component system chemotaxis response regulator CheY